MASLYIISMELATYFLIVLKYELRCSETTITPSPLRLKVGIIDGPDTLNNKKKKTNNKNLMNCQIKNIFCLSFSVKSCQNVWHMPSKIIKQRKRKATSKAKFLVPGFLPFQIIQIMA